MSFPPGVFILQYLPECDELVLMKDGQIAEHGTHTQLMEKGRDYAALFNSVQQEVRCAAYGKTPGSHTHKTSYITHCKIHEPRAAELLALKC